MRGVIVLAFVCISVAAWTVAPASAKISAMSGACDGRGKPPEVVTPGPKKKTRVRRSGRKKP
jgi:hypothetical protein